MTDIGISTIPNKALCIICDKPEKPVEIIPFDAKKVLKDPPPKVPARITAKTCIINLNGSFFKVLLALFMWKI